jgi:hypothetical protein
VSFIVGVVLQGYLSKCLSSQSLTHHYVEQLVFLLQTLILWQWHYHSS